MMALHACMLMHTMHHRGPFLLPLHAAKCVLQLFNDASCACWIWPNIPESQSMYGASARPSCAFTQASVHARPCALCTDQHVGGRHLPYMYLAALAVHVYSMCLWLLFFLRRPSFQICDTKNYITKSVTFGVPATPQPAPSYSCSYRHLCVYTCTHSWNICLIKSTQLRYSHKSCVAMCMYTHIYFFPQ